MGRFIKKWGQKVVKERRWDELKGLLEGWQIRAEGASDLELTDEEKESLKSAAKMVKSALSWLNNEQIQE